MRSIVKISPLLFLLLLSFVALGSCEIEDYTTFTETDVEGVITVQNSTYATITNYDHATVSTLCRSLTISGDFTHYFDARITDDVASGWASLGVWGLWNSSNLDWVSCKNAGDGIFVYVYSESAQDRIYVREYDGGTAYNDYSDIDKDTPYYVKVVRSTSDLNVYIYTGSDYTGLYDTLTLSLHNVDSYTVVYAIQGTGSSTYIDASAWVANHDFGQVFGEVVPETLDEFTRDRDLVYLAFAIGVFLIVVPVGLLVFKRF